MSEMAKTLSCVGAALLAMILAWEPWRQRAPLNFQEDEVGQVLFPEFKDPHDAESLEVMKYNEETAELRPFRVAKVNGIWSIPSHSDYPADAGDHLARAATSVLDLKILGVASHNRGDHELFGVIEPDPKTLKPGMTGVGTRVTFRDGSNHVMADLVVGKEVKDQPRLRYVRRVGRDQVYRVAVKTDELSTKFEDWIEKDLLKLNPWDIQDVQLNNYSIHEELTPDGALGLSKILRSQMKFAFDDAKSAWNLVSMKEYNDRGEPVDATLAKNEELNSEKLDGLKSALDDLQIVDVQRKPAGVSRDLRTGDDFVRDREALESLALLGFYPLRGQDGSLEILSSEGEVICQMKDGVQYILRFGRLAGADSSEPKDTKDATKPGDKSKPGEKGQNRFLFVMAKFNPDVISQPQLEDLPATDKAKATEAAATDESQSKSATPSKRATRDKPLATKAADKNKKMSDKKPEDDAQSEAADAETTNPEKADNAETKATSESEAGQTPDERRAAVERRNKRKQDEYDSKIKKGQDHAKELNDRFADWYYVISDDVYKKIHLGRTDLVKKKEKDKGPQAGLPGGVDLKSLQRSLQP